LNLSTMLGLGFVLGFIVLVLVLGILGRNRPARHFREIPAFARLGRAVGMAVEAGSRLHISLGRGGTNGPQIGSALVGLGLLERIARAALVSDSPPVATSGEGALAVLSQDTLRSTFRSIGAAGQYSPEFGQMTGVTPFSYAAGALPVIHDGHVTANVLTGHFGSEVALMAEAAERSGSLTLGGSDDLTGQAVLYATAQEPLIGEDLFAAGAYTRPNTWLTAGLRTQDIFRWILVAAILVGAVLKLLGFGS
jgi:hypothetical protein